jgi:hypothetical protein
MRDDDERDDDERRGRPRTRGQHTGINPAVAIVIIAIILVGAGVAAWFAFAGGDSTEEVIAAHRQKFAEMRAKLKRIAGQLPPAGTVGADTLPANLTPRPVFDVPNGTFNTAILMAVQCEDPDRDPKSPAEFNLRMDDSDFQTHLLWTGDKSPLVESARKSPAKDLAERFARSLSVAYLVVARPARYDPPRAGPNDTFLGGDLDLEVFLVDLPGEEVLGGFRRVLRPDANVMVTFRTDRKESDTVENFVYSNMWSKARAEVATTLARTTGGSFAIERK